MLNIPYVGSSKNACALACYTMVAKYFFPDITFERIAQISDWHEGYVVWGFKFWLWIAEKGIKITDYDLIDTDLWIQDGVDGLRKNLSEKEFNYIYTHTKDLEALREDLKLINKHPNFTYHRQKPNMALLRTAIEAGNPAEVVLDSHTLDRIDGFALHRVVVTDMDDSFVTFHDPREIPQPYRKVSLEHFENSWLRAVKEPELCIYEKL
jgi:hypothetical protein